MTWFLLVLALTANGDRTIVTTMTVLPGGYVSELECHLARVTCIPKVLWSTQCSNTDAFRDWDSSLGL